MKSQQYNLLRVSSYWISEINLISLLLQVIFTELECETYTEAKEIWLFYTSFECNKFQVLYYIIKKPSLLRGCAVSSGEIAIYTHSNQLFFVLPLYHYNPSDIRSSTRRLLSRLARLDFASFTKSRRPFSFVSSDYPGVKSPKQKDVQVRCWARAGKYSGTRSKL